MDFSVAPYPQQPYPQQPNQAPPGYQYPPQQYPQYQQYPQQPGLAPPPRGPRRGLVIGVVVAVVVVVVIVSLLAVAFVAGWLGGAKPKTVQMNCAELSSQLQLDYYNYRYNLRDLNAGDTLILRDTITYIYYSSYSDKTYVTLAGGGNVCNLSFHGDITSTYSNGNIVEVTFHIINIDITIYNIHITGEYFREMVDPVTNTPDSELDPSIMRKVG